MNGRFWKSTRTTPLLWEFLLSLLQDSECREFIKWLDEAAMTFKIVNSYQVATLWGEIKGRPNMDQNKLRRAIRQYYKSGVMKKVKGQKGGYKFEKLPYNPFNNHHHQNIQQQAKKEQPAKEYKRSSRQFKKSVMPLQERNDFSNKNYNYFLGESIARENLTVEDKMNNCQNDHHITDSESEGSFESWLDEENIDVLMWSYDHVDERDFIDSFSDDLKLDYL